MRQLQYSSQLLFKIEYLHGRAPGEGAAAQLDVDLELHGPRGQIHDVTRLIHTHNTLRGARGLRERVDQSTVRPDVNELAGLGVATYQL